MADIILQGKIIITGRIKAETALHVGGSKTGIDIGGVENTVIKDHEDKPYIPGSSLKGKMRSLLEKAEGLAAEDKRVWQKKPEKADKSDGISLHICNAPECAVCNIFGRNNGPYEVVKDGSQLNINQTTPSRLLLRDGKLIESSIPEDVKENLELEWTEVKWENSIDRITSAANPRQQERVPRGAEFELEMVYSIYTEQDKARFRKVLKAIQLLEDDYLGGSGSRGYGKISFNNIKIFWNTNSDYETGNTDVSKKTPKKEGSLRDIAKEIEDNAKLNALFATS
ncbi:MAG: type III-A CRISPR-associated RAMP protein Csm3 [Thermodesulfovibrionales bacterium]|nr:type III-A CRISPR-associated RAMP protein Csm3 [Thermodesulfovibrionales bacterium]